MAPQITTGPPDNSAAQITDPTAGPGRLYRSIVPVLVNGVQRGTYDVSFFMPDTMTNQEAAAILAEGFTVRWS